MSYVGGGGREKRKPYEKMAGQSEGRYLREKTVGGGGVRPSYRHGSVYRQTSTPHNSRTKIDDSKTKIHIEM